LTNAYYDDAYYDENIPKQVAGQNGIAGNLSTNTEGSFGSIFLFLLLDSTTVLIYSQLF